MAGRLQPKDGVQELEPGQGGLCGARGPAQLPAQSSGTHQMPVPQAEALPCIPRGP